MDERQLRLRRVVNKWRLAIAGTLVLTLLTGATVSYVAYVDPGTTTEERVESTWSTSGDYSHQATVTEANPVFETGRTLRNRSVYFTEVAPILRGAHQFTYDAARGNLTVDASLTLVRQSVNPEDGTVFWETTDTVETTRARNVAPGDPVTLPFELDTPTVRNETANISESLGQPPGELNVFLRAEVGLEGQAAGSAVDRQLQYDLPVAIASDLTRIDDPGVVEQQYQATTQVVVPAERGPLWTASGPLLLVVGLVGLLGLVRLPSEPLSDDEAAYLAFRREREEFDEWITTIRLPAEALDRSTAKADSLADLVDFAIDTNTGVVESPDGRSFSVLHGEYRYLYRPPQLESESPQTLEDGADSRQSSDQLNKSPFEQAVTVDSDTQAVGESERTDTVDERSNGAAEDTELS